MATDELHDADQVIGRITKRGTWDRRYRTRYEEAPEPTPKVVDPMREVAKIAGLVIFILLVWIAMLVYVIIVGTPE